LINKSVFSFLRAADNATLLAFAIERQSSAVDRYLLTDGPTAANPPQRRAAGEARWDGQTDRRTDARQFYRPCSAHTHEQYKQTDDDDDDRVFL